MSTAQPEGKDNVVRGAVQDIAYLGDLSIYLVKLATGKVVRVTQPNTSRHAGSQDGRTTCILLSSYGCLSRRSRRLR